MEDIEKVELEEECSIDIELKEIALLEEYERIERQESKLVIPSEIVDSDIYKCVDNEAYAIANAFKILLNAGIDYANAMTISQSIAIGYGNKEQAKYQMVQQQNAQI